MVFAVRLALVQKKVVRTGPMGVRRAVNPDDEV